MNKKVLLPNQSVLHDVCDVVSGTRDAIFAGLAFSNSRDENSQRFRHIFILIGVTVVVVVVVVKSDQSKLFLRSAAQSFDVL